MLVRFAAACLVVLAGTAILVAPDRPAAPEASAPRAESAIALLGETWTLAAPVPVAVPPVAMADADPRPPEPEVRPLPRPVADDVVASRPGAAGTAALRTPLRRPSDLSGGPSRAPAVTVARQVATPVSEGLRWIVRDRGTGAVLAELPLNEALALMQARSLRP